MPDMQEAIAAAERVRQREEAAARVRAAVAAKADPVQREVAERLAAVRRSPEWTEIVKAIETRLVEIEKDYQRGTLALAEGQLPKIEMVQTGQGSVPVRLTLDEARERHLIRLAELRGEDKALEMVKALVPTEEEGA